MINVDHSEVVLSLGDPQLQKNLRDIYWLTSTDLPGLISKYVSLHSRTVKIKHLFTYSIYPLEVWHLVASHLF